MKTMQSIFAAVTLAVLSMLVQAQSLQKIKEGDKLNYTIADYVGKGRDVSLEAERAFAASISEKADTYTLKSEFSTTLFSRKNHAMLTRETPDGVKTDFSVERQFIWLPPQGDFSKPWTTSFTTIHPQCGTGKVTHDVFAKPVKYSLQIAGKATEVAAFEINFVGKWDFNNHCRSGKQLERFVYSPELDFVLERDQQNFNAQGFLNRGNNVKLKSVN